MLGTYAPSEHGLSTQQIVQLVKSVSRRKERAFLCLESSLQLLSLHQSVLLQNSTCRKCCVRLISQHCRLHLVWVLLSVQTFFSNVLLY